ncbi:hypothetical protein OB955_12100 [Halobacteria archaeon AArc-m2/3/4]|uniref:Uncharacterized protein n=1 Tax=Natronoglomus mannanivorans TaxID=2979990 RepID=A0AAP2YZL1_9EURY|nr:hypothetical protein [Halobacteria archaeon AArc-xg1-1]MCU4973481.1 hypothetical protein [Halobacteria archaeon AArc-m2/3/4]
MTMKGVVPSSLVGSVVFVGGNGFLPSTLALLLAIGVTVWLLRDEGIYGHYAVATAFVYLVVWVATRIGIVSSGLLPIEELALVLFGGFGLCYGGLQLLLQRAATSARGVSLVGYLGKIGGALVGAVTVAAIAWQARKIVSVQSFATVGLVPAALLNTTFRYTDFGIVTETVVAITSFATIGFVLAAAFLADSVSHAVSGVRHVRDGQETTDQHTVLEPNAFRTLPDGQFLEIVDSLACAAHDTVHWLSPDDDCNAVVYGQSGTIDELVIGRRARTLPDRQDRFERELMRDIESAVDQLGHVPTRVCFVTDVVLDDRFLCSLQYQGLDIVDAIALHRMSVGNTP